MVNEPPDFCPRCGDRLSPVDPPTYYYCKSCDDNVFHNPIPTARLAVVDGQSLLLVKVNVPDRNLWGTPGGMVEAGEHPDETAARELNEETTVSVDPDDLVLFDARTFPKFGTIHKTYLAYAVDAANVNGKPQAAHEVAAARYWTPEALKAADDRLLTSWPSAYKNLQWWLENAKAALN
ncbi:NUDIX hydrolase [Halomicrococcus sp. SG-WS-1]|uniref:NUDIX hydrolase n=1 Tax=Halomicrococcus sp. SG-WS-1 TaxID=3439057 RepID=UPI003F7AF5BA